VLFGAGQGTTLGSFAPRVSTFLATLAPDIGQAEEQALVAVAERPAPKVDAPINRVGSATAESPNSAWRAVHVSRPEEKVSAATIWDAPPVPDGMATSVASNQNQTALTGIPPDSTLSPHDLARNNWFESAKSALAVVGLIVVVVQFVKLVR
jgi:hypothetical protein